MNSPVIDQKSFSASASSSVQSPWRGLEKRVCLILLEELLVPLLYPVDPWSRYMVSDVYLLQKFWPFHLRLGNLKLSPFIGVNTSFALSLLAWISDASVFSNSSMSAIGMSRFQILTATIAYPKNIPNKTFGPNWCSCDRFFEQK